MALDHKNSDRHQGSTSRSSTTGKSYVPPSFVSTRIDKKKLKLTINKDKPLLSYQVVGIRWLWELHNRGEGSGGILGDDMGLGKTYQLCVFIVSLIQANLIRKVLLVCPSTLMEQWSKEFVGSGHQASIFYGPEKQNSLENIEAGGVMITTYETLTVNVESLSSQSWDYLVIDEGHLIKNYKTSKNNALTEVNSNHRVLLTGTMIQNNIEELWCLLNFCCPVEFDNRKHFIDSYSKAIYGGTNYNSTDQQKWDYDEALKLLKKAIKPYYIRRTKEQVLNLPKKHEVTIWLTLTESQRFMYQTFSKDPKVRWAISVEKASFEVIGIQKKICNHPLLVKKGKCSGQLSSKMASILEEYLLNNDAVQSCKLMFLESLLAELCKNGHYVLIFSQMKDMLTMIQEMPTARDYKCLRIDGDCPVKDRFKIVDKFQAGGAQILLLMTQVGGVGLTLTKADRVIVVDPSWNQSTDDQSICRAYRLGQQNDILVYRLLTCGTAEEAIYKKQVYKQMLSKAVMDEERPLAYFTEQERKAFFHINDEAFEKCFTQQNLDRQHECKCDMNQDVENHLSFLQKSNLVAGIGHHAHLFSEPVQPSKEGRLPHAMTPKEFVAEKKVYNSSTCKKQPGLPEPPLQELKTNIQEKVEKLSAAGQRKHSVIPQTSWSKTSNRPSCQKQPAIPHQQPKEVKTSIRPVSSSRYPGKELCLKVPSEMVGFLIGKDGVTIQKLQAESKTRVEFCDGDQPNVRIARITGSAEGVLLARSLINEKVKKLLAADQRKHSDQPFSDTGQGRRNRRLF